MNNIIEKIAKENSINIMNIENISDELSTFLLNNSDFNNQQLIKLITILSKIKING